MNVTENGKRSNKKKCGFSFPEDDNLTLKHCRVSIFILISTQTVPSNRL